MSLNLKSIVKYATRGFRPHHARDVVQLYRDLRPSPTPAQVGVAGEMRVKSDLAQLLPSHYKVLHNVYVPNPGSVTGTTEIDLLVIGRSALFLLEVKNIWGYIQASRYEANWPVYRQYGTDPIVRKEMRNPVKQAISQKLALNQWLAQTGGTLTVIPMVIMINPMAQVEIRDNLEMPLLVDTRNLALKIQHQDSGDNDLPNDHKGLSHIRSKLHH